MTSPVSRRRALTGAATLGVAAPVLAACGDDGGTASDPTGRTTTTTTPTPSPAAPTTTVTADAAPTTATAGGLGAASEVPVGGGVVLRSEEVVVTQPTAGQFKAFSAICTHQGCLVSSVTDGQIVCECHHSMFSIEDGAPESGPAPSPLPEVSVQVTDGQVQKS